MSNEVGRALFAFEAFVATKGGEIFGTQMGAFYLQSGGDAVAFRGVFGKGLKRALEGHGRLQYSTREHRGVITLLQRRGE